MKTDTALSLATRHRSQFYGFLALALFFVSHNIGAVFYQIRGVDETHYQGTVIAYFSGLASSALLIRPILSAVHCRGNSRLAAGAALLGITLFPPLLCLATPFLLPEGYAGNRLVNTLQPGLWAMQMPLAVHLFFKYTRPSRQAYYYCISLCAGHLCWSLLIPLAQIETPGGAADFLEERYLPLLNVARLLTSTAFTWLVFKLIGGPASAPTPVAAPEPQRAGGARPRLLFLMIPLLLCFFYNGVQGYLYFPRLVARGLYAEYLHLVLAVLFPVLGIVLRNGGIRHPRPDPGDLDSAQQRMLLRLMTGAALCFALAPVLLAQAQHKAAFQAMYFLCAVCLQILFMTGTLVCGRYAAASRWPSWVAACAWIAGAAAVAGNLAAKTVLPLLPGSPLSLIAMLCLGCIASLFLLKRAFPLPAPAGVREAAEGIPPAGRARATSSPERTAPAITPGQDADVFRKGLEARKAAYAESHKLSKREREVMELLIQGKSTEEIAQALGLKIASVRHYVYTLLKKTGTGSRLALVSQVTGNTNEETSL